MFRKLFVAASMLLSLSCFGQTKNFTVSSLNVDGLPPSISVMGISITLNPDGAREVGSTRISELIAQKGWDFCSFSEDFNYHEYLISQITDQYNIGSYRGTVSASHASFSNGKLKVNTDGLEFIWKKSMSATGETCVQWNKTNGYTDSGSDELLKKGYRYYCVQVANGLSVDVYVHHMDAETSDDDIAARESQINQLVAAIKASNNRRPIIIMGDTNCRYTRDKLKELLIDAINDDERFEIHDPWVDFQWDGVYPTYGDNALMTAQYGSQKGEVVDKIFYINNTDADGVVLTANSYLHDMDFSYADGTAISDHYPIVIDFTLTNTSNGLVDGSSYYIRNVGKQQFLANGLNWGVHTMLGKTGNYITVEKADGENQYYLKSTCGYINHSGWMDKSESEREVFTITRKDDGKCVITYDDNGETKAFGAAFTEDGQYVNAVDYVAGDETQEWEFLSKDELVRELDDASEENPMDATFFIKGANFSRNDGDNSSWTQSKGKDLNINYGGLDGDVAENNHIVEFYNKKLSGISLDSSGSLTQSVSGLPNGKYRMSVQAFKREDGDNFSITANGNGVTIPLLTDYLTTDQVNDISTAAAAFSAGYYTTSVDFVISDQALTVKVNKDHTTSTKWYAFDNFQLTYMGMTEEQEAVYDKVKKAMDDAQAKATAMGLQSYDNSTVEERYVNRTISGDGTSEVKMTYVALANAAKSQVELPADMRYVIFNNSFEMGDLTFWTGDGAVEANAEALNADGTYTFTGSSLSQSTADTGITLQNGIYELSALLSNGGKLTANGVTSAEAVAEDGQLAEVKVRFPVTSGTAEISATGMSRADNFVLVRVDDNSDAYDMLRAAISDANTRAAALGAPYNNGWDLSEYQELVDTYSVDGTGLVEFNEIYAMLRKAVAQRVATEGVSEIDATDAIINNSFEMGETWGWSTIASSDTGVKENSNSTYTTTGCDGSYLYNTWWQGTPVTQVLSGLYPGTYKLSAKLASDDTAPLYLVAGDNKSKTVISGDNTTFVDVEVEFTVGADESIVIGAVGGASDGSYTADGEWWYKVDDFKLTYMGYGDKTACVKVQTAITDATERVKSLGEEYLNDWDLSEYQAMVDNNTIEGDGDAEFNEIYGLLRAEVAKYVAANGVGADASDAIINNSFEMGKTWGWSTVASSDTGIKQNSNSVYAANGCDGYFLYNTYWQGTPLKQTISGLVAGTYKLSAKLASDNGAPLYLVAGDNMTKTVISGDKTQMVDVEVEFTVGQGEDVTIAVVGGAKDGSYTADGYWWYKADDFKLTYVGGVDIETEINYTYSTLILPYAHEIPANMEVYTASAYANSSDATKKVVTLTKVNSIEANTPYVVKYVTVSRASDAEFTFSGVPTNTEDSYTSGLLTGTLVDANVSTGNYIFDETSSQFKAVSDDATATVGANHAYIAETEVVESNVTVLDVEEKVQTGVDAVMIVSDEQVDVFGVNGVQLKSGVSFETALDGLEGGVYIVRSASAVIKVMK